MFSFPWEWTDLSIEERLIFFFIWLRKDRDALNPALNPETILEMAEFRCTSRQILIKPEGRNGCYNGSFRCDAVYSSCVILPNSGHDLHSRQEYYIAVLATLMKREALSPSVVKDALQKSISEDREMNLRYGGRYLFET